MPFKTILVYLNDEHSAERVLKAAVALTQKNDAHLIGLHVSCVYQIYATVAVDLMEEISEAQGNSLKVESKRMRDIFDKATKGEGIKAEWRNVQAHSALVAEAVVNHARCADLIVAGQPDPDRDDVSVSHILERFLIDSGRPVLIIPYLGTYDNIGKNITIAWNSSRESARATTVALPLLETADQVTVLWVNADAEYGTSIDLPGSEIATCLSRHGVKVETNHSSTSQLDVGDEILSRLSDSSADLLVMGAYGHSRLREFMFGGASRHILQHMTLPVLMAH